MLLFHGGWGPLDHDGAFLDNDQYRKVYIHQRGWGKSYPAGCLDNNTVQDIIQDCEDIRKILNIGGGSVYILCLA